MHSCFNYASFGISCQSLNPDILMLIKEESGKFLIQNPAQNYKTIFTSETYEENQMWLLEDEYERVTGRFCQPE
ncbi:hypothetical protein IQ236_13145 [Planktothrix mougeotii LEGE 06226]|uniref:Uncharacterized protein n=1 Tax=Planktothrix mougeotii LEGE 06226 TaxID=1828728 RepID=A0ABR9UCH1_9CYAN|nr:hypothetical protein [Planktothrix mougeotii LEGE 06226]